MTKKDMSYSYMNSTFNCCQSVFAPFAAELGLDSANAFKIASAFGSGMRKGEVCGAVTGALMAIGLKFGQSSHTDLDAKSRTNELALEFQRRFTEKYGSTLCRLLLKNDPSTPEGMAAIKSANYHKTLCSDLVMGATEIVEQMFAEADTTTADSSATV